MPVFAIFSENLSPDIWQIMFIVSGLAYEMHMEQNFMPDDSVYDIIIIS